MKRTYKIIAGPPAKSSFASDIALQYGINYEQVVKRINKAGQVSKNSLGIFTN